MLITFIRAIILYIIVLIVMRLMGKEGNWAITTI